MREPSPMAGEKNLGVTLSRTLIPTLPTGYLSRKRLFPLLENEAAGTTFLIAPGGYGKTSLVAEWAQYQSKGVIWMTVAHGDTINEMSAMLIAATQQVLPHFAPWFENEQPLRPTEVVRRWGNELLQTGKEFVFVLDNLRNDESSDVDIAVQLVEQFPTNIHFVVIRRDEINDIYPTLASRGAIKVITQNELRFTEEEVEQYAVNSSLELTQENRRVLMAANGWPSATSLLRAHIQSSDREVDLVQVMSSESEPLRAMAMVVTQKLDSNVFKTCKHLSVLPDFTLEDAEVVLGEKYSFDLINGIAQRGEIFKPSRDPRGGYSFSPMVREVFLENLRKKPEVKAGIHKNLIAHFERTGNVSAAIDHAFESGDQEKIQELFPDAARMKQAEGKGGDLLRWANFAGDSSVDGELKKSTVRTAGFLTELDFKSVKSEVAKMQSLAPTSELRDFFLQFTEGALSYIYLTTARFAELEGAVKQSRAGEADCYLGFDDQINILRNLTVKRYISNESDGTEKTYLLAQELVKQTTLLTSHTFLLSIQAMHLHQRGEYKRAFEVASVALSQHQRYGFVGNHGPLDAMFVMARCLLEFSRPQEALAILEQIRAFAYQWKQWHWYIAADKHIIEFLSYNNNNREALERVKRSRDFVTSLDIENGLANLVDICEMPVRRRLQEFDRLEKLVKRAPNTRDTQQYRMAVDEYRGRKSVLEDAKRLPEKTPRDVIWKYLMDVSLNVDSEKIAMAAMHQALKVGAEVGAKETFLRQRDDMANYIIKIANDFPTIYNEELATAMAERMRERGNSVNEGQQSLTKRELEILRQLSTGRTLTVIAAELHISQNTMKTHLKNLYRKIGAEGRHDAVEKAKSSFLI